MPKRYYLLFKARGQLIKMQISPGLGKKRTRVAFQPQTTKCQIEKNEGISSVQPRKLKIFFFKADSATLITYAQSICHCYKHLAVRGHRQNIFVEHLPDF